MLTSEAALVEHPLVQLASGLAQPGPAGSLRDPVANLAGQLHRIGIGGEQCLVIEVGVQQRLADGCDRGHALVLGQVAELGLVQRLQPAGGLVADVVQLPDQVTPAEPVDDRDLQEVGQVPAAPVLLAAYPEPGAGRVLDDLSPHGQRRIVQAHHAWPPPRSVGRPCSKWSSARRKPPIGHAVRWPAADRSS